MFVKSLKTRSFRILKVDDFQIPRAMELRQKKFKGLFYWINTYINICINIIFIAQTDVRTVGLSFITPGGYSGALCDHSPSSTLISITASSSRFLLVAGITITVIPKNVSIIEQKKKIFVNCGDLHPSRRFRENSEN